MYSVQIKGSILYAAFNGFFSREIALMGVIVGATDTCATAGGVAEGKNVAENRKVCERERKRRLFVRLLYSLEIIVVW